jgi:trigger factor
MGQVETGRDDIRIETHEISPVIRELAVEVEARAVDAAFSRVVNELRKSARVKGFRPGKVPPRVIKQMYGPSLAEEIERSLVRETLPDAVELAELRPVVEPQIEAEPPVEGKSFAYRARIEVKPEIELPDLEKLSGSRPRVSVGEDEVLTELESLRERHASWVEEPEETRAEHGHQLTIDFVGTIDGVPFEGGRAEGVELELGSGRMIPGFEDQLIGVASDEARDVEVDFPDDYGNPALAGKRAVFAVRVSAIKRRELPELDDEFAKDLGDFENLDEVRDKLRETLEAQRKHASDHALHRSLLDDLIARTRFEVPPSLVERQLESQLQQVEQQLKGRIPDADLRARLAQLRDEGWDDARRRVQEALLLEAVARSAGLEASEEDLDARLEEMAAAQGVDAKLMRDLANAQGWATAIAAEIVDRKALAHLAEHARVQEADASEGA